MDSTYLRCVWFHEGRGFLDSVRLKKDFSTEQRMSLVITAKIYCCGRSSMQRVFLHGCRVLREIKIACEDVLWLQTPENSLN